MVQDAASEEVRPDPDPRQVHDRQAFTAALGRLKDRSGLSYRELERATASSPGARFGLPFTTVRDYVQGRSLPTADRLDHIVWACGVTADADRRAWSDALGRVRPTAPPRESSS